MIITITATGEAATFKFLRVDFTPEALVTSHPVERGAEVTDHVQVMPLRFSAEVMVTASPLSTTPDPFAIQNAVSFFGRALGQLLTVAIPGERTFYYSMVLEAAPHSRTAVEGRTFALRFKYVRIAESLSVTIPPRGAAAGPAPSVDAGAPTEQPLGVQSPEAGVPTSKTYGVVRAALGLAEAVAF